MRKAFAASFIITVLLTSCTPKATTIIEPVKTSAEQLAQGKTIFENACKRCHDLPDPTAYTSVQWVGIMISMAPNAKLNDAQHQWVYDYVVSVKK